MSSCTIQKTRELNGEPINSLLQQLVTLLILSLQVGDHTVFKVFAVSPCNSLPLAFLLEGRFCDPALLTQIWLGTLLWPMKYEQLLQVSL